MVRRPHAPVDLSTTALTKRQLQDLLTNVAVELTPELRDRANPRNPYAANAAFAWDRWHSVVPKGWAHGEDRQFRWGLVLPGRIVVKAYSREFLVLLAVTAKTIAPLLRAHQIEVPFWYESRTRPDIMAGVCFPKMTFEGQDVRNGILLSSRQSDPGLVFTAIHEAAHCIAEPASDLDPTFDTLGHHESFSRRQGLLLREFLETDRSQTEEFHYEMRMIAQWDTWGKPIHPLDGWRWDEVPVRSSR